MSGSVGEGLAAGPLAGDAIGARMWRAIEVTAGLMIGAMAVLVTYQVFGRYVLNDTPPWTEELCRYLFVWASFLGACVAMRHGTHLGVDSLVTRLPAGARETIRHAVSAVVALFVGILVWQGMLLVPEMGSQRSPSMGISLQYVFAAIPIAGAIMLAVQVRGLVRSWLSPRLRVGVALVAVAALVIGLAPQWVQVSPMVALAALVGVAVILIVLNTPIAFAVGIACVVYVVLRGDLPLMVVPHRIIGGMDSFLLLALPLFVLAGDLMNTGGITERLVGFARALVGHIRGGLGMTTVVSEYMFSGISGSSAADVSAVGSLLIPSMTRAGYSPERAVSIVAAASAMGVLVPPCLMMVVLASLTDLSVGALFIAGFLPAAVMAVLLLALIYVQAYRENLPREPAPSLGTVMRATLRGMLPLFAPVIILGGILGGIVTPTEAAVLAVIYALLLGMVIYRELRLRDLLPVLINTASLTGMVMLLVGTASVLSWIFASQGVPKLMADFLLGLSSDPMLILLVTILVFVPLGAVLEGVPAMIILVPVFFPIIARFGVDPLHYGVLVVASLGLGLFVPPFGVGFFIACALGKTSVEAAARAYLPYLIALLVGLLLVAFVPWITLVLPRMMNL